MKKLTQDQLTRLMTSEVGRLSQLKYGPAFDAAFDPFVFEGEEFFYLFNSNTECWQLQRTLEPSKRKPPEAFVKGDKDRPLAVVEALNALAFMPPPVSQESDDAEEAILRSPFWYRDLHFAWVRFPREAWAIAVCGNSKEELLGASKAA